MYTPKAEEFRNAREYQQLLQLASSKRRGIIAAVVAKRAAVEHVILD